MDVQFIGQTYTLWFHIENPSDRNIYLPCDSVYLFITKCRHNKLSSHQTMATKACSQDIPELPKAIANVGD